MDSKTQNDPILIDQPMNDSDTRLRILYLYRLLLTQTDEKHPLTTKQIMDQMRSSSISVSN